MKMRNKRKQFRYGFGIIHRKAYFMGFFICYDEVRDFGLFRKIK